MYNELRRGIKPEAPKEIWGISSVGRASALHAEGQEFESPILHHFKKTVINGLF